MPNLCMLTCCILSRYRVLFSAPTNKRSETKTTVLIFMDLAQILKCTC